MPQIVLDLDEATCRKLDELSYSNERRPEDLLRELIVEAIHSAHFFEVYGYHE